MSLSWVNNKRGYDGHEFAVDQLERQGLATRANHGGRSGDIFDLEGNAIEVKTVRYRITRTINIKEFQCRTPHWIVFVDENQTVIEILAKLPGWSPIEMVALCGPMHELTQADGTPYTGVGKGPLRGWRIKWEPNEDGSYSITKAPARKRR